RQIPRTALKPILLERPQVSLNQLDVRQHFLIDRNWKVVRRPGVVRFDDLLSGGCRVWMIERRRRQQLVNDCRFRTRLRKSVTLAQRDHLERVYAVEQMFEFGFKPGRSACAER